MADNAKTHQLSDVVTNEVSLVDRGAVRRKFAMRKKEGSMMDEILKACLETTLENEAEIDAKLEKRGVDKKAGAAIKGAIKLLSAFKGDLQDSHLLALRTLLEEMAQDEQDEEDGETPAPAKKNDKGDAPVEKADMMLPDAIKAQFEAVRKAQEKAAAEATELRKELEQRKDQDHLRQCVEKAATQYADLGPARVLGPVIQKLEKAGLFKEVEGVLRGANERARMGGTQSLLKEQGTSRGWGDSDADSADARLQKAAVEIAKSDNVPLIVAHAKACEKNPELYQQYQRETALRAREGR
jgi:hypothetical protein